MPDNPCNGLQRIIMYLMSFFIETATPYTSSSVFISSTPYIFTLYYHITLQRNIYILFRILIIYKIKNKYLILLLHYYKISKI